MEERQVTIDGETHDLPKPFMVMATQNPVEYSGTFPLPEAQLDRFLMKVRLGYLSDKAEAELLGKHKVESPMVELQPVVSPNELTFLDRRIPAWFHVTLRGARPAATRMTAAAHFMVDRYAGFDGPATVSPPPSR
jgi:MoxR-like ATPase